MFIVSTIIERHGDVNIIIIAGKYGYINVNIYTIKGTKFTYL